MADLYLVPSPATVELLDADDTLAYIRERGGRVLRMREAPVVICLTSDEELVGWLRERGASLHTPRVLSNGGLPPGSYLRARDAETPEWDLWITTVSVSGEKTLWEAAGA